MRQGLSLYLWLTWAFLRNVDFTFSGMMLIFCIHKDQEIMHCFIIMYKCCASINIVKLLIFIFLLFLSCAVIFKITSQRVNWIQFKNPGHSKKHLFFSNIGFDAHTCLGQCLLVLTIFFFFVNASYFLREACITSFWAFYVMIVHFFLFICLPSVLLICSFCFP